MAPGVNNPDLGIFIMSKFCVKPFIIAHISVISYQILFGFCSWNLYSIIFHNSFLSPWVRPVWCQRSIIRTLALSFCQSFALNLFDCSYLYNCIAVSTVFLIHDMYIAFQYGALGQMHGWDQGSVTRTLPFVLFLLIFQMFLNGSSLVMQG